MTPVLKSRRYMWSAWLLPLLLQVSGSDIIISNCAVTFECESSTPYKCLNGNPSTKASSVPAGLKIAFFGDSGMNSASRDVLDMIEKENVDLVLHAGDLAYDNTRQPERFLNQIQGGLDPDTPVLAVFGNHDINEVSSIDWNVNQGYEAIWKLASKLGTCKGETGMAHVCTFKGITIVAVAPGIKGIGHDRFIKEAFEQHPSRWRICMWHKTMALFNTGSKPDETGWAVYEQCRRMGAIIITAHEHAYGRTYPMSSMSQPAIYRKSDSKERPSTLQAQSGMETGTSVVLQVGTGGFESRAFSNARLNPWWAHAEAADTGLVGGAVICEFNVVGANDDGDVDPEDQAHCKFLDENSRERDDFWLETRVDPSNVPTPAPTTAANDQARTVEVQVRDGDSDAQELGGKTYCSELYLGLGQGVTALDFGQVPVSVSELRLLGSTRIRMVAAASTPDDDDDVSWTITLQRSAVPAPPCFGDMQGRTTTQGSITWQAAPWVAGEVVLSPDLSPLIAQLIDDVYWFENASLLFLIEGHGNRYAWSYEGDPCQAPTLIMTLPSTPSTPSTPPTSTSLIPPTSSSSSTPPTPASCPALPNPFKGQVLITGNSPASTASYSCDDGYKLSHNRPRVCMPSGTWSDAAPVCEQVTDTQVPPDRFVCVAGPNVFIWPFPASRCRATCACAIDGNYCCEDSCGQWDDQCSLHAFENSECVKACKVAEPPTPPITPPTTQPTTKPTTQPTNQPTTKPTTQPTTDPTTDPTTQLTTQPTSGPTAWVPVIGSGPAPDACQLDCACSQDEAFCCQASPNRWDRLCTDRARDCQACPGTRTPAPTSAPPWPPANTRSCAAACACNKDPLFCCSASPNPWDTECTRKAADECEEACVVWPPVLPTPNGPAPLGLCTALCVCRLDKDYCCQGSLFGWDEECSRKARAPELCQQCAVDRS